MRFMMIMMPNIPEEEWAPTPEAIRRTAARNELPVDRITQVHVLDPYFYTSEVV